MRLLVTALVLILSASLHATECKTANGAPVNGSIDQLRVVMRGHANRPQVLVTGTVAEIFEEDHSGLPHQKFSLKVAQDIKLTIVTNLEFGRIPVVVGKTLSVCGEYIKAGQGMVHWTHFDPHDRHANGYTLLDGVTYGNTEVGENN